MRKLTAPAAILLGLAGAFLRLWSLRDGYEPLSQLPIPGAVSLTALTVFFCAVPVLTLLPALRLRGIWPEEPSDLYTRLGWNGRVPGCLAGLLLLAGGVLRLIPDLRLFSAGVAGLPADMATLPLKTRLPLILGLLPNLGGCAVDVLLALAGIAMIALVFGEGVQRAATLVPGFAVSLSLVVYYHANSQDPVVTRYCWTLLCLIASMLALYYQAGYSFGRVRPIPALTYTVTAGVYAFSALPDSGGAGDALMLLGLGLWMALHCPLILRQSGQPEAEPEPDTEPVAEPQDDTLQGG